VDLKILLIQPDYPRRALSSEELRESLIPSYSLILLSELLEQAGHKARVLDGYSNWVITGKGKENDLTKGLRLILEKEQYELVGISVYTAVRKEALELAQLAKELCPNCKLVLGGPHPTRLWQSMLMEYKGFVDFVVLGGADRAIIDLANNLQGKGIARYRIPGLAYLSEGGEPRANSRAIINVDLENQPSVGFKRYFENLEGAAPSRAYLVSTRGCRYWCNFCSKLWKKTLYHPLERVEQEARALVEDLGVEELVFYDDCLGQRAEHTREVFKRITGFKRKARLVGVSHFQLLAEEWLIAFKSAGGEGILLGLESGASKVRRKMNKHIDDKEICDGVELVRKMGLKLGIYIMVGFPNESPENLALTKRLIEKIAPEQVIATVYDIKPGDMMIEWGLQAELIKESDYFNLDRRLVNYMSEDELESAVGRADYFETRFTKEKLLKDSDPAWWILGMSEEKRESLRKKAEGELGQIQG